MFKPLMKNDDNDQIRTINDANDQIRTINEQEDKSQNLSFTTIS